MINSETQLRGFGDPRLALHATSPQPAWLWSLDGARILWANPVAIKLFGAADGQSLCDQTVSPADPHRRQVSQLAMRLVADMAPRLERLRGFGAAFGSMVTCACTRLEFAGDADAILIVAATPPGRSLPLPDRMMRLVEGIDAPLAILNADGTTAATTASAKPLTPADMADATFATALESARASGAADTSIDGTKFQIFRLGTGPFTAFALLAEPAADATVDAPEAIVAEAVITQADASAATVPDEQAADGQIEAAPAEDGYAIQLVDAFTSEEVEPVAEAPAIASTNELQVSQTVAAEPVPEPAEALVASACASASPVERHIPLRFMWQMDAAGHFSLGSDEFTRLIGARTASGFGRRWVDIVTDFDLDPDNRVAKAVATRDVWSGITLLWPADGGMRLAVELSGVPIHNRSGQFAGYRGFGVCRDLYRLTRLANQRQYELFNDPPTRSLTAADVRANDDAARAMPNHKPETETSVEPPQNVVHFRPGDIKSPKLTQVENNAFNELARQLSARLESETTLTSSPEADVVDEDMPSPFPVDAFLRDTSLLDLLPVGVLISSLDRLVYANSAFLQSTGFGSLHALEAAGGLDALLASPKLANAEPPLENGTLVTISTTSSEDRAASSLDTKLYHTSWSGEPATALISEPVTQTRTIYAPQIDEGALADSEDLAAILDTMAEGILMFDANGRITSCNRCAEALFGYDGDHLLTLNLIELFVPESRPAIRDALANARETDLATLLDTGREALGQVSGSGIVPLSVTIGRTRMNGPNFFAVFRDLTQTKKTEAELSSARRQADRANSAKADALARVSHEVRTPLNAIIGFAEVMIDQRFGPLGNERYIDYMKDIRASGERVMVIVNDLLDLSRIESGDIDLSFSDENLNDVVEQCVGVMQAQANRARIIIRSSLAAQLPPVTVDARALRQIALNLIGKSITLANSGGQVIVSTALSDLGEVILRVRDTGHGLNDNELAAAMEPFHPRTPDNASADNSGASLSLTKALIEANRARFHIRSAPTSGTLIEVVFATAPVTV